MSEERRPLLIVHVIHRFQIGGLENGVVNLINRLPRERFRHVLVCVEDFDPEFARRIERDDVELIAMHRSQVGVWRMRWRLWRLLRRLRPDVVHSRNLSGLDALLPARLAGIKTLHSEHGFDMGDLHGRSAKLALLRRLHAPLVLRYLCVSHDLKRIMSEQWGIAADRIRQIYNGVDTDRFKPAQPPRHELMPVDKQGSQLFVIGTIGRVQPVKDQATLLRAVALLIGRRPEWRQRLRVAVIGDGPQLSELQALAGVLGIEGETWFTGARHDVADLLQALDLFVLPSLNEGISNTLLEAMATGLPLLATRVGGNVELVNEGVVGATFQPGDAQSLSVMIENYASDAGLCARHGQAARQRALRQFSLAAMMAAYQDAYETL